MHLYLPLLVSILSPEINYKFLEESIIGFLIPSPNYIPKTQSVPNPWLPVYKYMLNRKMGFLIYFTKSSSYIDLSLHHYLISLKICITEFSVL